MAEPTGTEAGSLETTLEPLLAGVAAATESALTVDDALRRLAAFCCDRLSDAATLSVVHDGRPRNVAGSHRDPALAHEVLAYVRRWPPGTEAPAGVGEVLQTRRAIVLPEVGDMELRAIADGDPERLAALRCLRPTRWALLPLLARGRTVGTLGLGRAATSPPFSPADLPVLEAVAARASLALDNVRLLEDAQAAEATLGALLDQAPIGVGVLDLDLRYVRVNAALAALNGAPVDAHVGRRIDEVLPHLPPHTVAELQWVLDTGEAIRGKRETTIGPDGHARHFEASYVPIAAPDGPVTGVGVLVDDVTVAHRHERERERMLVAERAARLELHAAHRRSSLLADVGAALEAAADVRGGLEQVAAALVRERVADVVSIDVLHPDGRFARLAARARDAGHDAQAQAVMRLTRVTIDHPDHPVAAAARLRRRQVVELTAAALRDMAASEEHLAALESLPVRVGSCDPLVTAGRVVGVLSLGYVGGTPLHEDDPDLLEDLVRRLALAVAAAQVREEREAITAQLQSALLPPALPEVPGLEIAARHVTGSAGLDVGGDFYDVFRSGAPGEQTWTVLVGDVCGKGAEAAVATATARHAARALADERTDPADLLMRTNTTLLRQTSETLRFVTMVAGRLAPRPGGGAWVDLACAGHPPPLLLRADGTSSVVPVVGPLLGVKAGTVHLAQALELEPGDALVLYTDGLTDPRGGGMDPPALALLAGGSLPEGPEAVADVLLALARRRGEPVDDVALLVLSARPAGR